MDSYTSKNVPAPVARSLRELGDNVRTWRKLRGLSRRQLAERADVSLNTITRIEAGSGGAGAENLFRVARSLGILDRVIDAWDPYETDIGRLRANDELPERVRQRRLDHES